MAESDNVEATLKPFYERATEAEDRLARLEAVLAEKKGFAMEELLKRVFELQSELENVKSEQVAERQKTMKEIQLLTEENEKLKYRIIHLIRAVKEDESKLASK